MMAILFKASIIGYAALDLSISFRGAVDRSVRCGLWLVVVFPILHLSYGIGYLKGIFDFLVLHKREITDPVALSRSR